MFNLGEKLNDIFTLQLMINILPKSVIHFIMNDNFIVILLANESLQIPLINQLGKTTKM